MKEIPYIPHTKQPVAVQDKQTKSVVPLHGGLHNTAGPGLQGRPAAPVGLDTAAHLHVCTRQWVIQNSSFLSLKLVKSLISCHSDP